MSRINHRRGGLDKADPKVPAPGKDYCNGKRGERRDVAGAKKYVHSRHRSNTKNNLAELAKAEQGTDYSEVMRETVYESNYQKRYNRHKENLPWETSKTRRFLRELKGRGYHNVPDTSGAFRDGVGDSRDGVGDSRFAEICLS